ncbi:unnamed protein product, partial [Closterium sp. NIES-54]
VAYDVTRPSTSPSSSPSAESPPRSPGSEFAEVPLPPPAPSQPSPWKGSAEPLFILLALLRKLSALAWQGPSLQAVLLAPSWFSAPCYRLAAASPDRPTPSPIAAPHDFVHPPAQ